MIKVENLFYEYPGKLALDNVSLKIEKDSITALVGPNGAGKSTLMRCIAALDEPFSGKICVAGFDVSENSRKVHKEIGYLSDFFGLYDDLTVRQSLVFFARIHQIQENDIEKRVKWAADLLGITDYMQTKAGELSRGWRQRLGIAQTIIHRPKLLLLDEPASGLDPEARLALSNLFHNLRTQGMTLLVSSHILAELEDYCSNMLILREGKVVEHKTTLASEHSSSIIEIKLVNPHNDIVNILNEMKDINSPKISGNMLSLCFLGDEKGRCLLLNKLIASGLEISSFSVKNTRLQDVYMALSEEGNKNS